MLIAGDFQSAEGGRRLAVENPATEEILAEVADAGPSDARRALDAAVDAFPAWRDAGAYARSAVLRRWFDLMRADRDNLARLMTLENGKPLKEAYAEADYAASFVEWFSEEAKRAYGRTIPATNPEKRILVLRQPVGVVAAITPWNFPAAMITRKVASALAAGCTVVLKPAPETPLTALRLGELLLQAGAPPGVLNVVPTSDARRVADVWLGDSRVRKITFTGSTAVGKELMRKAADNVQRLSLELGGQAPFIVFSDADLDVAVSAISTAKFRNAGQTCVAANRVLVAREIEEEFTLRIVAQVAAMRVGSGLDPEVEVGPMINGKGRTKVLAHVEDAVSLGAEVRLGGRSVPGPGYFVEPTVLSGVTPKMLVMREETFGPVIAIAAFSSEAEAVATANDTEYGLAAYFFTRDAGRAWRVAEHLEYGIVGLNDGAPSTAQAPFGGYKESGVGREGGQEGMDAFLETKYVSWGAVGTGLR
ncbi:MAG: NAD-dependent succinate-semialdehyde dehydrogenase [Thermaerobacter sp.]|nr:NAD-dependent succinate-semialdehyde dehydrogenase [Thermaerobacter sp.]